MSHLSDFKRSLRDVQKRLRKVGSCHGCAFEDGDVCGVLGVHLPCVPLTGRCKCCCRCPKPSIIPFKDNFVAETLLEEITQTLDEGEP